MAAAVPSNEAARLAALRSYQILDTEEEPAFGRIAALAARWLNVPYALVSLVDANRQWFKACVGTQTKETPRDIAFCAYAVLGTDVLVIPDTRDDARFATNPYVTGAPFIRSYAGAPLQVRADIAIGTLCTFDTRPRAFSPDEIETLRQLAAIVVDELELRNARMDLARLATIDDLTGVANRRVFRHRLEQLVADARRGRAFVLAMLDIDHFKRYNDQHGHQAGDRALAAVARALSERVRATDHVSRYGGEEFAVLLADTDLESAARVCEELRATIAALPLEPKVTASFGIAAYGPERDPDALIHAADLALYEAKRAGRDRVSRG